MRKSCLLFTCLYRTLTHCFQQEETVLPRVVLEFLLLEYLHVSQMMKFAGIKLCLDHIHHLLLQLAISRKSKCFNSHMNHYLMLQDYKIIKIWWIVDDCCSYFINQAPILDAYILKVYSILLTVTELSVFFVFFVFLCVFDTKLL